VCWKFGVLEKLAKNKRTNIRRKKTNTKGLTLLKNVKSTREQTQEERE